VAENAVRCTIRFPPEHAARRLELARSTLRHKIKKYALEGLIPND
jgi:DNA-binding protein Fis